MLNLESQLYMDEAMTAGILVVEDDNTLRELLEYNLKREGYSVLTAVDGAQALEKYRSGKPQLIILDIMLPIMSGTEVCRIIRGESQVPIIMLTAKTEEVDRVVGVDLGADDYVTKPFSMRELLSRIKAVLRRSEAAKNTATATAAASGFLEACDIRVDLKKHEVVRKEVRVELNPKEFELLALLMSNRGQVFSREQILRRVWGYEYIGSDRTVDVHIRWMRRKLETDPDNPQYLLTVRGYGYKFAG